MPEAIDFYNPVAYAKKQIEVNKRAAEMAVRMSLGHDTPLSRMFVESRKRIAKFDENHWLKEWLFVWAYNRTEWNKLDTVVLRRVQYERLQKETDLSQFKIFVNGKESLDFPEILEYKGFAWEVDDENGVIDILLSDKAEKPLSLDRNAVTGETINPGERSAFTGAFSETDSTVRKKEPAAQKKKSCAIKPKAKETKTVKTHTETKIAKRKTRTIKPKTRLCPLTGQKENIRSFCEYCEAATMRKCLEGTL